MPDPTIRRRKIIGVMGSASHESAPLAEAAGRAIAEAGYHLLTGAGDGVMAAAARGFTSVPGREGLSIGIVRADGEAHLGESNTRRDYQARGPNDFVEIPIFTHLPHSGRDGKKDTSRNHINVLTPAAVVVLPGESGTRTELELATQYGRPVVLFLGDGRVDGSDARALHERYGERVIIAAGVLELRARLRELAGDPIG